MKLLIYGHSGWIGSLFIDYLNEIKFENYVRGTSRVDNGRVLENEIKSIQPTHVVSFIGRTHGCIGDKTYNTIDYLEQPNKLEENIKDNLFSPLMLAIICKHLHIHYTYLGTGCIFSTDVDNINSTQYAENDIPNFTGSSYSTVKGFTDRLMHKFETNVLNVRIRMPIVSYHHPRNFISKITSYHKICSVANSMSVLPELLPILFSMMKMKETGTINFTNPGTITHNEILEMYAQYVDPSFTWNNFSIEEQDKVIDSKRSNNRLDTSLLERKYYIAPIKESLIHMFKYWGMPYFLKPVRLISPPSAIDASETVMFVTGGAGFIGSHFINRLFEVYNNIRVINFDALYYSANECNVHSHIRSNSERYTFVHGNLQSIDLLKYIFQTNRITHVFHFAAQSHVQTSFTDALTYSQDNIIGTHNLLEMTRIYCKHLVKFIHVSTDEVYGETTTMDEDMKVESSSVLCPTNPYAATKASAELIAQSYYHSFKMPIIITRGNNVYGSNQYPEKLIPKFIQQLHNNQPVTIQGTGDCMRAFLHVSDTANAFICILEKGQIGEIYNIGCDSQGMEYSIIQIAHMLIQKIKKTNDYEKWITYIEDRPYNDKRYYISNEKLKMLGWTINKKFDTGIDELL